jgi:hypothetical protein
MKYPRFVFISPGKNTCQGGTYDHELVQDEKDHKAALAAGFVDSLPEALEAAKVAKDELDSESDGKPAAKRGRKPKEADNA